MAWGHGIRGASGQTGQEEGQGAGTRQDQGWSGITGKASTVRVKLSVLGASFLWDIARERMDPPSSKLEMRAIVSGVNSAHQGLPGTLALLLLKHPHKASSYQPRAGCSLP